MQMRIEGVAEQIGVMLAGFFNAKSRLTGSRDGDHGVEVYANGTASVRSRKHRARDQAHDEIPAGEPAKCSTCCASKTSFGADRLFATEGEVDDIVDDWREFFERRIGAALVSLSATAAKLNGRGGMKSDCDRAQVTGAHRAMSNKSASVRRRSGERSKTDSRTKRSPRPRRAVAKAAAGDGLAAGGNERAAFVVKCSTSLRSLALRVLGHDHPERVAPSAKFVAVVLPHVAKNGGFLKPAVCEVESCTDNVSRLKAVAGQRSGGGVL